MSPTRDQVLRAMREAMYRSRWQEEGIEDAADAVMALLAESRPSPDLSTLAGRLRHDAALADHDPEARVLGLDLAYLADVADLLDAQPQVLWDGEVRGMIVLTGEEGRVADWGLQTVPLTPGTRVRVVVVAAGGDGGTREEETAKGRTHSVYKMVTDMLGGTQAEVVVCRGCSTRWPVARTDLAELERQPCGTPAGRDVLRDGDTTGANDAG